MKIVYLQSENKRKAYETPLLRELGEVRELTKSEKGSTFDDGGGSGLGEPEIIP